MGDVGEQRWLLGNGVLGLTGLAVVHVSLTVASGEAGFAAALVAADGVLTNGSVLTGILHTFIYVDLTGLT